ncbi:thiamine-phosphate pyrophosphorylase [Tranquillimonas rosea]|uniref:Thiamine-phosphate pyrophosphorylase n=1 Tax=Tranquillimonas rosea TaxID=641238 RepID=A0A1H9VG09_9RHOB|nr:thiamine phosphate synthase [Tranquillimonas rosea]SES20213.1 thiamine-phosphate pyrophosphorylase [Tranquillimonas rosea]
MAEDAQPQLYLITPPDLDLETFPDVLSRVLDTHEIACLRLRQAARDEDRLIRAADTLRELTHARDIPLVIEEHLQLVERLGLDGVHLNDGARSVRAARKQLGQDPIVGAFCGGQRHEGMNAGESGADYIAFGPVAETSFGDGRVAEDELFAWWSEMIEVPVVAEGALAPDRVAALAPMTDFFAIGDEIWTADDPVSALTGLVSAMR